MELKLSDCEVNKDSQPDRERTLTKKYKQGCGKCPVGQGVLMEGAKLSQY